MMTSISISKEKELGTMEILLASPLKPIQIVLGESYTVFIAIVYQRTDNHHYWGFHFWGPNQRKFYFPDVRKFFIYPDGA